MIYPCRHLTENRQLGCMNQFFTCSFKFYFSLFSVKNFLSQHFICFGELLSSIEYPDSNCSLASCKALFDFSSIRCISTSRWVRCRSNRIIIYARVKYCADHNIHHEYFFSQYSGIGKNVYIPSGMRHKLRLFQYRSFNVFAPLPIFKTCTASQRVLTSSPRATNECILISPASPNSMNNFLIRGLRVLNLHSGFVVMKITPSGSETKKVFISSCPYLFN